MELQNSAEGGHEGVSIGGAHVRFGPDDENGATAFSLRDQSLKLPRPDGSCWVRLYLPPGLWDEVAKVLEAWPRNHPEPFYVDELPVSGSGYLRP